MTGALPGTRSGQGAGTEAQEDGRTTGGVAPASATDELLRVLAALLAELGSRRGAAAVALDSSLERDLGLDSLGRMELLARLERAFGLALPERELVTAETPRDLLAAIGRAGTLQTARSGEPQPAAALAADRGQVAAPPAARTLVEVLEWHADRHPDRRHILFYPDGEEPSHATPLTLTYSSLLERGRIIAGALSELGVGHGEAVAIMLPSGLDYFAVFAGILLCGAIPVPLYPPVRRSQIEDHLRRQVGILSTALVKVLVTFPEVLPLARLLRGQAATLERTVTVGELEGAGAVGALPRLEGDDIAFVQFTSGSTGSPKGVVLTHRNLLANLRSMCRAAQVDGERDVMVSWLPLYHDMGLIGAWMASLERAMPLVLLSPLAFLARPARWLQAIDRHRGTISAAPNFAYELCLRKLDDAEIAGLDLSSWRLALNGAEPVSPATLERFAARLAPCGFRRSSLFPVYGLAENSLGVAFPPLGRGPLVLEVDREALARDGRAESARPGAPAISFVGCGFPIPDHEVRIVDGADNELPERQQGRLQFRGPSATRGYYRDRDATAALIHGDWLESGDLAFIADGEIFITGRVKDVIIRAGRNVYPQELEQAVGEVAGARRGCVAVFGAADPTSGTERLVVLAETRESDPAARERLQETIQRVAVEILGTPVDEVALVGPHCVPKTSSGKVRRAASRQLYEQGRVGRPGAALWLQLLRLALASLAARMRGWRRTAAALGFAGWAWALFVAAAVPVWTGIVLLPTLAARRRLARGAARALARAAGATPRATGIERLDRLPACVVAVNHASYLDAVLLTAVLPPRFAYVAKRELTRNPLVRVVLARLGTLFVERSDPRRGLEDTRAAREALVGGTSIVIFPEGALRRAPGLQPFRMGAFVLAAEAGVPVVPAALRGTRSMLRGNDWYPRHGMPAVVLGEPVSPQGRDWSAALALRAAVRAAILRLCGEPDLAEHDRG